ncbi:ABC transporter ATP-binding protein [Alkalibaculum bacchi]|mgnify:CR=1 FL=1|uniref:oligopeptide/dipeptide ABC transporter ATP-binding protein n=1 Tax=Alkalibaculum bacchi TaxID=645887 RepID=UPI0026EC3CBB|nr:ABC transporter ATP-binding protein [Alkalibaculum bacchi]
MKRPLLEINNLSVGFRMNGSKQKQSWAVNDLSIRAYPGEILTIVGASGSGKSVLASAILGLLPGNAISSGEIIYDGKNVDKELLNKLRGEEITFIPQSISSLDPLVKVGKQVRNFASDDETIKKQRKIFKEYGLNRSVEKTYPFQLSGGMARRVLISTTVMKNPRLIIADEPTPGLDIQSAKKTMDYFKNYAKKDKAIILITHDIDLAIHYSDKLAIFYGGQIVEITKAKYFHQGIQYLKHPYTRALYRSLPTNGFKPIPGSQPIPDKDDQGCIFRDRCECKVQICDSSVNTQKFEDEMVRCNVDFTSEKYRLPV